MGVACVEYLYVVIVFCERSDDPSIRLIHFVILHAAFIIGCRRPIEVHCSGVFIRLEVQVHHARKAIFGYYFFVYT